MELVRLMRATEVEMVVHLAFTASPARDVENARDTMWQTNVAGTARVMEAITEVNRHGGNVRKFIFTGSASVYGPETAPLVDEDAPLAAHTLPYALDHAEADHVVRFRSASMGHCSTTLLRAQAFAGAGVESFLLGALQGRAYGTGPRAARWQQKGRLVPYVLPTGHEALEKQTQFVHVEDLARLVRWLLDRRDDPQSEPTVLNVAAPGQPLTRARCVEIASTRLRRCLTQGLCVRRMNSYWKSGLSAVPPEAFPYLSGSNTVSIDRLRTLLGADFSRIIRFTSEEAFAESIQSNTLEVPAPGDSSNILSLR